MRTQLVSRVLVTAAIALVAATTMAAEVMLNQMTFPEKRDIDLEFLRTQRAPAGRLEAEVEYRDGQAQIKLSFERMKPAILFGGDITSYVLWAVLRDGTWENLGELWVRQENDTIEYSTGLKSFALMVTAETYPLVQQPSELVLFTSAPLAGQYGRSSEFTFTALKEAPARDVESITTIPWDSKKQPLDLAQAEKAFELAQREGVDEYTPNIMRQATTALAQARNLASAKATGKATVDYSRRTVALASEAMLTTSRRKEDEALQAAIEQRRQEMAELEARAEEAEQNAKAAAEQRAQAEQSARAAADQRAQAEAALAEAQSTLAETRAALADAEEQKLTAGAAIVAAEQRLVGLNDEKVQLEQQQAALQSSVDELAMRAERLREERDQLSQRLQGALSQVAETRDSARGFIVNLPDILFDTNEATLKADARVVLAKLAGILLIMPELNLRVEGHTDATGSEEHNQLLSERRSASVRDFMAQQGIDMNRMVAVGYGESRPAADNDTTQGRKKNRRVEIVIKEGLIAEEEAPAAAGE